VGSLIATDDPEHGRLRKILSRQFTPRSIAALETQVREVVAALTHDLPSTGVFDFVAAFAAPLPTRMIALYLGIDPERWRDYKRWSDVLNEISWAREPSPELGAAAMTAVQEALGFFAAEIAARRTAPKEDLIGRLTSPEAGLSDDEIINFCVLLMLAGNVTTSSVLSHAVMLLLSHPDQLALLRADPTLIDAAVEEVVRLESPIQGFVRTLTGDVVLHGQTLAAGEQVMLLFGAANRDARVFSEPEKFDVTRDASGHVAFGAGPHFCLGSWLARLEVRVALEMLLPVLVTWRLDPAHPMVRLRSPAFREIAELPVALAAAP
jgi:cytochrome P450